MYWVRFGVFSVHKRKIPFKDKGKYLSEALIFASVNPQHDARLFMELQVQYMTIPCAEHLENMLLT